MQSNRVVLGAFFLLIIAGLLPARAQSSWTVEKAFHIGGDGGWDYVTADPEHHRLFVTRTTHTLVLDADSGKVLGDIPGQKTAHGVAIDTNRGRGFITDGGGTGAIVVFDLNSYATLGRILTVPDSDGIIYDPKLDRVLAVSGDGGVLMVFKSDIDPQNGKVDQIKLDGAPEFLASDGAGKVYINLEDKDVVAVVDVTSQKVVARWPVAPGGHPVGMSMDPKSHRLFIGCGSPQKLVVMNADNGKIEAAVPIGAGVDATAFHDGQAFASCRDGSLAVAQGERQPIRSRTNGQDTGRSPNHDHRSGSRENLSAHCRVRTCDDGSSQGQAGNIHDRSGQSAITSIRSFDLGCDSSRTGPVLAWAAKSHRTIHCERREFLS